jgi:hypothetical protein
MRRRCLSFLLILFLSATSFAYTDFSAGIVLGNPAGGTFLYEFQYGMGFDFGTGWSFLADSGLTLYADLLWLNRDWVIINRKRLPVFYGIGLCFSDGTRLGFRVPVGFILPIAMNRNANRLDLYIETALILNAVPSFSIPIPNIGLGVRYAF